MIIKTGKIEHSMETQNPFVATMYHLDNFPRGNGKLGPNVRKNLGMNGDYDLKADWRMYYGKEVPGFPAHPHRGFETVTVVVRGTVDHTDGLGSKGRYANGDVQWMTAGKGLQHAEMFPLINTTERNPLELFQIWLSLDSKHRMVEPAYKMLWSEDIPVIDDGGVKVTLIAGELGDKKAPAPTKDSWASEEKNHVSIQLIEINPGASYEVPSRYSTMNRSLYFYEGDMLKIDDVTFTNSSYAFVTADDITTLKNEGSQTAKVLLLEAEPINEEIVPYGPFVMSSMEEVRQAYRDYEETQFGGWPFNSFEVYHGIDKGRFAEYPDGRVEYPGKGE